MPRARRRPSETYSDPQELIGRWSYLVLPSGMADDGIRAILECVRQPRGAYVRAPKKFLAIENYQESVQLDLQNRNGSPTLFSNFETRENPVGKKIQPRGTFFSIIAASSHFLKTMR